MYYAEQAITVQHPFSFHVMPSHDYVHMGIQLLRQNIAEDVVNPMSIVTELKRERDLLFAHEGAIDTQGAGFLMAQFGLSVFSDIFQKSSCDPAPFLTLWV